MGYLGTNLQKFRIRQEIRGQFLSRQLDTYFVHLGDVGVYDMWEKNMPRLRRPIRASSAKDVTLGFLATGHFWVLVKARLYR